MTNERNDLIRTGGLKYAYRYMMTQGVIFDDWGAVKAPVKKVVEQRNKGRPLGDPERIKSYHFLIEELKDYAVDEVSNALRSQAFQDQFAIMVGRIKEDPAFQEIQARRLRAEAAVAAAALPPIESSQIAGTAGNGLSETSAESVQPDAGLSVSSALATPKRSTTGGASLGVGDIPLTPGGASLGAGGIKLFDISSGIKTPLPTTPSVSGYLRSATSNLFIGGGPADTPSVLTGITDLSEVTKPFLMDGFLDLDEMHDKAKIPDVLKQFSTDPHFASMQLEFIVDGQHGSASALLNATTGFNLFNHSMMTGVIKSEREKHEAAIVRANEMKDAAQDDFDAAEKQFADIKVQADVAEKRDISEKTTRVARLAKEEQQELARVTTEVKAKYQTARKELRAEFDERDNSRKVELANGDRQQKILLKLLRNAISEVTKRKEIKIETVELAQQHLDLMTAGAALVAEIPRRPSGDPKLQADFDTFIAQVNAYNAKVDKINRGTLHAEAAGGGSA